MLVQVCAAETAAPRECSVEAGESPGESFSSEGVEFRPPPCPQWGGEGLPWIESRRICGRRGQSPRRSRCRSQIAVDLRSSLVPRFPGPQVCGGSLGYGCERGPLPIRVCDAELSLLESLGCCELRPLPVCVQEDACGYGLGIGPCELQPLMFLPHLLGAEEVGLLLSLQLLQLQLLLLVRWHVLRLPCLPVSAWLPVVLLLHGAELQLCVPLLLWLLLRLSLLLLLLPGLMLLTLPELLLTFLLPLLLQGLGGDRDPYVLVVVGGDCPLPAASRLQAPHRVEDRLFPLVCPLVE